MRIVKFLAIGMGLILLLLLGLLVVIMVHDSGGETPTISIRSVEVRLPAVPGRPAAAYFDLGTLHGPTRLTGLSSTKAVRIEMHETISDGGISRMVRIPYADLSDRGVTFAPGGKHAMIFDLAPDVTAGSTIPLTFHYEAYPVGGSQVRRTATINAPVVAAGAPVHEHH